MQIQERFSDTAKPHHLDSCDPELSDERGYFVRAGLIGVVAVGFPTLGEAVERAKAWAAIIRTDFYTRATWPVQVLREYDTVVQFEIDERSKAH